MAAENATKRLGPVVLLDLDGVLNPFAAPTCPDGYAEAVRFPGEDPVRYCLNHGAWIDELVSAADVWWATAWGEQANSLFLPLLRGKSGPASARISVGPARPAPLPVVEFPPVPFPPEFKLPAVAAALGDRPAAWIDDEHTDERLVWARQRAAPTLLVSIDPSVGWSRCDIGHVLRWISSLP